MEGVQLAHIWSDNPSALRHKLRPSLYDMPIAIVMKFDNATIANVMTSYTKGPWSKVLTDLKLMRMLKVL